MFFTSSDLTLTPGLTSGEVDRLLLFIEADLKEHGIVFTTPTSESKLFYGEKGVLRQYFAITYVTNITEVSLVTPSSSKILVDGVDYIPSTKALELVTHAVCDIDQYISITGTFGYYIDLDSGSIDAKMIEALVTEYLNLHARFAAQGYKNISEAKTATSQVKYEQSSYQIVPSSIVDLPQFQKYIASIV